MFIDLIQDLIIICILLQQILLYFRKECGILVPEIYNDLPPTFKQLSNNISKFKVALKIFLFTKSFHILEEYYR